MLDRLIGRVFGRRRFRGPNPTLEARLEARARASIDSHAREHATLVERAERLAVKARRLEEAGTPSESAGNRAARAREEVEAGLTALRDAFVVSEGGGAGEAFDREVGRRFQGSGPRRQGA